MDGQLISSAAACKICMRDNILYTYRIARKFTFNTANQDLCVSHRSRVTQQPVGHGVNN